MPVIPNLSFSLSSFTEVAQELGSRLRALRLYQELSQVDLASRAGVSRFVVQELEAGRGALQSVLRVSQALGRIEDLQPLFKVHVRSIREMEAAELPKRQRAPRKS